MVGFSLGGARNSWRALGNQELTTRSAGGDSPGLVWTRLVGTGLVGACGGRSAGGPAGHGAVHGGHARTGQRQPDEELAAGAGVAHGDLAGMRLDDAARD